MTYTINRMIPDTGIDDVDARAWVPGFVSSLRHYADFGVTVAFQINTDVGVVDDSSDLVPALEAALANEIIASLATGQAEP